MKFDVSKLSVRHVNRVAAHILGYVHEASDDMADAFRLPAGGIPFLWFPHEIPAQGDACLQWVEKHRDSVSVNWDGYNREWCASGRIANPMVPINKTSYVVSKVSRWHAVVLLMVDVAVKDGLPVGDVEWLKPEGE